MGKMTKKKDDQKLDHKEREIRNKRTPEWKVNHGLSKKQHLKEEIMRNRERLSLLSDRHKMSSGT